VRKGSLVRVSVWECGMQVIELGIILRKHKFYLDSRQPWQYEVLLGDSGKILLLHENAPEKVV